MGNRTRILIIAAVLVIAAVAVGLYAFFGGESGVAVPPAANSVVVVLPLRGVCARLGTSS